MQKLLNEYLVCTADQVTELLRFGVAPVAFFCYEFTEGVGYEFAGEYFDQAKAIPAWTMEELFIMIGPEWGKPDMMGANEWTEAANMMQFAVYLIDKRVDFASGAQAYARYLIELFKAKAIKVDEVNERLKFYLSKEPYNRVTQKIAKEIQQDRKRKK